MGFRLPGICHARHVLQKSLHRHVLQKSLHRNKKAPAVADVPKGHFAIYVCDIRGEAHKRFVVPVWYLKHPLFQGLLYMAEEEFGFEYQKGAIRLPCKEEAFVSLTSQLEVSSSTALIRR